jgi:hypothetical protein
VNVAALLEPRNELVQQAALPDPRRADDGRDARAAPVQHARAESEERVELLLPSDEARLVARPRRGTVAGGNDLPDRDRLAFAFGLHGLRLAELERIHGGEVGGAADQDPVPRRSRLDSCCRVEDVPRRRPFALARTGSEHYQRLACVDPDADVEVEPLVLGVQLSDALRDGEPCADRALRVVLVGFRRAEERKHSVAAELLERAAVALELGPYPCVVWRNERLDVLGVELLGARGRADEVHEDRSDDLSLFGRRRRRRSRGELGAAGQAEPRLRRVLGSALRAKRHVKRLRRR